MTKYFEGDSDFSAYVKLRKLLIKYLRRAAEGMNETRRTKARNFTAHFHKNDYLRLCVLSRVTYNNYRIARNLMYKLSLPAIMGTPIAAVTT